jgi:adenine phosphoribosyltransferase
MTRLPGSTPARSSSVSRKRPGRRSGPDRADAAIDTSLLEAEVMDRSGYPYLIHPLIDGVPRCEPLLMKAFVDWALRQDVVSKATLIVAPEAMGFPLASLLSVATGLPYVAIRKRRYDLPGEEVAYCETGYGENCLHINDAWPDDRVLVVDDVLSTGATLDGILTTFDSMGVPVVGAVVFLDKGNMRSNLARRHKVPIRAMRTIKIEDDRVKIVRRG